MFFGKKKFLEKRTYILLLSPMTLSGAYKSPKRPSTRSNGKVEKNPKKSRDPKCQINFKHHGWCLQNAFGAYKKFLVLTKVVLVLTIFFWCLQKSFSCLHCAYNGPRGAYNIFCPFFGAYTVLTLV